MFLRRGGRRRDAVFDEASDVPRKDVYVVEGTCGGRRGEGGGEGGEEGTKHSDVDTA